MKKVILLTLLILVVCTVAWSFEWLVGGYGWEKNQMSTDVRIHLASKGYQPNEIKTIDVKYNRKLGEYTAHVIFSDDSKNEYYYEYINEKITQTGLTTIDRDNAKHLEDKK